MRCNPFSVFVACTVVVYMSWRVNAGPTTAPARVAIPPRHSIQGLIEDAVGHRVQAFVFVIDAETGIPYSNLSDHPFSEPVGGGWPIGISVHTGGDGRFLFPGVFEGRYRIVAQSWEGDPAGKGFLEIKSDSVDLRGVAENVQVIADHEPSYVTLKPLGTVTAHVSFARDGSFILVSTHALSGDPILQHLAWKGDFLRHLLGFVYLRKGQATFHGLPAGPLYFYALYNGDVVPAFGDASSIVKADDTVNVTLPVVSPVNGERTLSDHLGRLRDKLAHDPAVKRAIDAAAMANPQWSKARVPDISLPLDDEIAKTADDSFTLRDLLTLNAYQTFNDLARQIGNHTGPK